EPVLGHRLELAPLGEVQLLTRRQVGDRRDAAREIAGGFLGPDAGEVSNMARRFGPAAADERAVTRLEAMQADRDVGQGPREHLPLALDPVRGLEEERDNKAGDGGA